MIRLLPIKEIIVVRFGKYIVKRLDIHYEEIYSTNRIIIYYSIFVSQKPEYISFREFLDFEKYNIMSEQELYELNKLYFHYYAFLENKIWFTNLERNCDVQKDSIEIHHGKYSLKVSPKNLIPYILLVLDIHSVNIVLKVIV